MKITLVRHIKTSAPEGMCYGQTDVELLPGFELQHLKIAELLKSETFDAIWSSPLQRCALLAKAVAKAENPVNYNHRLKELNFGDWEQKMWNDIEKLPEAKFFFDDYINTAPPKGESFTELKQRINSFLEEIMHQYKYQHILIISHGGPIRAIHALANDTPNNEIFNIQIDYGEITQIEFTK
jgi:alpha-ribazole phosphatase